MKRSSELEYFLSEQRLNGQKDSEGAFTVAGARAVGQLAEYLLVDPSHWILKVVQSACVAESPQLEIVQARRSTQFRTQVSFSFDSDQFEQSLVGVTQPEQHPCLTELATALRAVGVGQRRHWVLSLRQSGRRALIHFNGSEVSTQKFENTDPLEGTLIELGVAYPPDQMGKIGGILRFGEAVQNEYHTLLARARTSTIPLLLDNRRIDDLHEPPDARPLQKRLFLGVSFCPELGALTSMPIPPQLLAMTQSRRSAPPLPCAHSPFLLQDPPPNGRAAALCRWFYNYTPGESWSQETATRLQSVKAPSRLCLVRRGVVVGSRALEFYHPVSCDVFLPAEHLRTDLTGLKVDPGSQEVELGRQALKMSLQFVGQLRQELEQTRRRPVSKDILWIAGFGALSLASPWFAVKAVTGAVSTMAIAKKFQAGSELMAGCLNKISDLEDKLSTNRDPLSEP